MHGVLIMFLIIMGIAADLCGQTTFAAIPPQQPVQNLEDGKPLAAEIRNLIPEKETVLRGNLRRRNADGTIQIFKILSQIKPIADGWISIYEIVGEDGNIKERLTIHHSKNAANKYDYEVYEGNNKKTIENPSLSEPLAGSDFFLGDLGLEFFHWKNQTIVKTEMRKSRVCKVLESVPDKSDNNFGYSRVVSWIDKETLGILIAEAYDSAGKKIKQFEVSSFRKDENGVWQIQELEIRNLRTRTKTQLIF